MATNDSTIIEILDSSDESDHEATKQQEPSETKRQRGKAPRARVTTPKEAARHSTAPAETIQPAESTDSLTSKRMHNRRKSLHQSINATENLCFESIAVDQTQLEYPFDDDEMEQWLRKIAYGRVFTNYLLRQYNMLMIDFKLYGDIDLLKSELNKRVDTYKAIRRSRQRLFQTPSETNGGM